MLLRDCKCYICMRATNEHILVSLFTFVDTECLSCGVRNNLKDTTMQLVCVSSEKELRKPG